MCRKLLTDTTKITSKMTPVTKNFSLEELCHTNRNINNVATGSDLARLKESAEMLLQPLREAYGKPIKINSGYRSKALNTMVGGSSTSSHCFGYAFDLKPADGDMRAFQRFVLKWAKSAKFDQIIIEQPTGYVASWIHIGWKRGVNEAQRRQILGAKKVGGKWQYFSIYAGTEYYNV